MREISDGLGNNPGISLLAAVTYWLTQLIGHVNELVSMLTGIGAFVIICLTIVGKWHEIERNKRKGAKGSSGVADSDRDSN